MLEIRYFEKLPSTQLSLKKDLKNGLVTPPIAYFTQNQTQGIGSRGNRWIGKEGNFFLSFALTKEHLPDDIALPSLSIYFAYIFKMVLSAHGSKVWLKWPNDLYVGEKKCGGCMCEIVADTIVTGIGIDSVEVSPRFGALDIQMDPFAVMEEYFRMLEEKILWKEIFSKFEIEFHKSKHFFVHVKGEKVALRRARLLEDGSVMINNERVYSTR